MHFPSSLPELREARLMLLHCTELIVPDKSHAFAARYEANQKAWYLLDSLLTGPKAIGDDLHSLVSLPSPSPSLFSFY